MLSESRPIIRRVLRFLMLPLLYFKVINFKECTVTKYQVFKDLFYIFFRMKYFPDNYLLCKLWEKDRSQWHYYYGSIYDPYQRSKLRKEVLPFIHRKIFSNKEVCYNYCKTHEIPLPKQYGVIDPSQFPHFIYAILKQDLDSKLVLKPIEGKGGKDVVLITRQKQNIYVQEKDKIILIDDFNIRSRSVVQECIIQHSLLSKISPSVNTIRIVTLLSHDKDVIIIGAFIRFGIGSFFIDNTSQGAIKVKINLNNGVLGHTACDKKCNLYKSHPTTGYVFKGTQIPFWEEVLKLASTVQKKLSYNKLIGMDIAISSAGPLLIEINDEYDNVGLEQICGPILKNKRVREEFIKYELMINNFQKYLT